MAKLVLSRGGAIAMQRFLDADSLTIGRDPSSDFVVDDPRVAAIHARVVVVGHDYILEAAPPAELVINGTACVRRILQHGDVAEFGDCHLKYVDSRAASPIDLERTMLIRGLDPAIASDPAPTPGPTRIAATSPEASAARFPSGHVEWIDGPHRGEQRRLDRVVATFGTPGVGVVVLTRRPQGFFATHVEGADYPRVNGRSIGAAACALTPGDVIEVAGASLRFMQP